MATSTNRVVLDITANNRDAIRGLEEVRGAADSSANSVKAIAAGLSAAAFIKFGELAAKAIVSVGAAVVELGKRGSQVADVSDAFGQLSARAGETSGVMLGALRAGFASTISDFDAMQMANRALGAGLVRSSGDMGTLASGARLLADRMGTDAKGAFDALMSSIASGRTKQLAQYGLFVDTERAVAAYAAAHGKAVKDLSDHERAAAVAQGTVAALRGELESSGTVAFDLGDVFDLVRAAVDNFRDSLGMAIATSPAIVAAVQSIGSSLTQAFGTDTSVLIRGVVKAIEAVVMATGLLVSWTAEGTKHLILAWTGFHQAVNNAAAGMMRSLQSVLQGMANMAARGAGLPVVGAQFKALAEGLGTMAEGARQAAVRGAETATMYGELGAAAASGANAVQAAAAKMVAAMMAAQGAATTAQQTTRQEYEATGKKIEEVAGRVAETQGVLIMKTRDLKLQADKEETESEKEKRNQQLSTSATWAEGIGSVFTTLGGKYKAGAIAGAILSTYAHVAKTLATVPWPASIAAAAAALAAGMANVAKIKSAPEGFSMGTPGLDFKSFGTVSPALLHGEEAVIPRGKGHVLASEIASALPRGGAGDRAELKKLDRIASATEALPSAMKRAIRDGLLQAQA